METSEFKYDFGIEGEFIRRNLRIYGNTNIEFDHCDGEVHAVHVETFIGAVPNWEQIDFSIPHHHSGIYEACERHLTDIQTENN